MAEIGKERWVGKFKIKSNEAIGELTYHPVDGISLEARIWPSPKDYADYFQHFPVIPGFTNGDRPCTLIDAGDRGLTNTAGEHLHKIIANTILLNVECNSVDEPQFTEMTFRSPGLTAFYKPRDIKVEHVRGKFGAFNTSYQAPEPIKGIWGEHQIQIIGFVRAPIHQQDDGSFSPIEFVDYQITFATPVSLNAILAHLDALEFILGIFTSQFAGSPVVLLTEKTGTPRHAPIRLLRSRPWYGSYNFETYTTASVTMKQMGDNTIPVLSRWFDLYPRLERIADVYRASQLISQIETHFLFLVQSIEGLHRICLSRQAIDPKEFDRGLAALTKRPYQKI
jgi:hypothetical protein